MNSFRLLSFALWGANRGRKARDSIDDRRDLTLIPREQLWPINIQVLVLAKQR